MTFSLMSENGAGIVERCLIYFAKYAIATAASISQARELPVDAGNLPIGPLAERSRCRAALCVLCR
ncbi:Protein of unknown function [Candidatus Hamiltonella defensa (Bemisia tabaci)]|nr:Protein of unknown function [Candidatus Hamiltonella defensa (Bemisia tabaci)]